MRNIFNVLFCSVIAILFFIVNKREQLNKFNVNFRFLSLSVAIIVYLCALVMFCDFRTNNIHYQYNISYDVKFFAMFGTVELGLDSFSIIFFLLSSFLIVLCILSIWNNKEYTSYASILLSLNVILLILFAAKDVFTLYVCFEAILLPMFLLIGMYGGREKKVRASYLFFFYTFIGSLSMMVALFYLFITKGTLSLVYLSSVDYNFVEECWIWLAFFIGFSSKIPMFPFHIWLPEAHVEAPTTGSVLLAGVLLKLGVYGFMRVHIGICYEASLFFSPLILTLSCLGVLLASFAAISQSDLKRLIAYSSVAHMNMLTMGVFCFQLEGLNGAILQCVSHAFVSSGLFFMVGSLYDRYHTKVIYYYGGLAPAMPLFAVMLTFFNLANIALPGTSSFSAELMLLLGVYSSSPLHCIIAGLSIFLGAVYSLWVNNRILFGLIKQSNVVIYSDLNIIEFFILAVLLCFTILLGVDTQLCFTLVDPYCIKLLR